MFLSSQQVGLLVTAFSEVQKTGTVKHGEQLLIQLRKGQNYELALATFISVSKDSNQKILATLQLKKILQLKYQQSFWSLKLIYYQDVQKISVDIRRIISHYKNIKWAGMFLQLDFQQVGLLQSIRYLELVFSLLKKPERVQETLKFHLQTLLQGLIQMIEVVQESEECLLMNLVCIATLFSACLELDAHSYQQRLKQSWEKIRQKCRFCMNDSICVVSSIIESMLGFDISNLQMSNLESVLAITFKNLAFKQNPMTKYHAKLLNLMSKYLNIFAVIPTILSFISIFNQYNSSKIDSLLTSSSLNIEIDLNNFVEQQLQSYEQSQIRKSLCYFIEQIFDKHYSSIARQYCRTEHTSHPLFYFLLALVNFYNSSNHKPIQQWIFLNLQNIIDLLGKHITLLISSDCNQQIIKDCIVFIEFLIKYKSQIPISLLIHVSNIIQEVSAANSKLSPFCYNFIQHVWKDFAYLDYLQLTDFLLQHITKLNQNQWDHKLQYYSCFLHLSQYLQEQHQFYSNFIITDPLVQQSLKSHGIMVSLIRQTPQNKIDHQLIILLLQLTSSFIKGLQAYNFGQFHKALSIDNLKGVIQSLRLYSEQSADLIVFDLFVKNQLPVSSICLDQLDLNGIRDSQFKLYILLKQLDYLKFLNFTSSTHNLRFEDEVLIFLDTLDKAEVAQLKLSKFWHQIEQISRKSNYPFHFH